jgi:hypothetical protein
MTHRATAASRRSPVGSGVAGIPGPDGGAAPGSPAGQRHRQRAGGGAGLRAAHQRARLGELLGWSA